MFPFDDVIMIYKKPWVNVPCHIRDAAQWLIYVNVCATSKYQGQKLHPIYTAGCNYVFLPLIPTSDTQVIVFWPLNLWLTRSMCTFSRKITFLIQEPFITIETNCITKKPHAAYCQKHVWNGRELGLFNDDTCPSGHISRPTHFSDILCNSFVFFNYLVIWILWLVGFNVPYLTFIDLSNQVEKSSLLQIFNDR